MEGKSLHDQRAFWPIRDRDTGARFREILSGFAGPFAVEFEFAAFKNLFAELGFKAGIS